MLKGQKKMRKKDIRTDQYFAHKRLIYDLHIGRSVAFFFSYESKKFEIWSVEGNLNGHFE